MGLFDKFKKTAKDNNAKVDQGIDKAADVINDKTDGKYADKVDTGAEKAKEALDNLGD